MFVQIESMPKGDSKTELVQGVIRQLSVHATIEEQVLYPAMRTTHLWAAWPQLQ